MKKYTKREIEDIADEEFSFHFNSGLSEAFVRGFKCAMTKANKENHRETPEEIKERLEKELNIGKVLSDKEYKALLKREHLID